MTLAVTHDVFERFPKPPCATLLGWELLESDPAGRAVVRFQGRPEFLNPAGFVQGGLLSAMLDDAMGPAVLAKTNGAAYSVTVALQVTFLAPANAGPLIAEARVIQLGKTIGFCEAELADEAGVVVARATSQVRLVPIDKLAAA